MEVFVRITKWIMVAAATLTAVASHAAGNVEAGAAAPASTLPAA